MIDFEELLAVAYKRERMQSRRLARGAAISEHAALLRTLTKAAAGQTVQALVDARRAAQRKDEAARRLREMHRAERSIAAPQREPESVAGGWRAWFDGSALPNPGRLGIGGVLVGPCGLTVEISAACGHGDSSVAEYRALIAVLEAALRERAQGVVIHGDSRVVIDDVNGPEHMGIRTLAAYAHQARALIAQLGDARIQWLPRARNQRADALSRAALELPPAAGAAA
ncbi:ribonuclease HI family protein [Caballeronia sp. LZ035]|uniref:ribonuclease HI family protein n=1 Tax=Caballeronia sp. LZ035 TaxID=3038568 RepID=UPI0028623F8C|nr:ribonuclease HI family protein [Caballeronia sp. LZ035]MDR5756708.1 ribonuclease HI family protein [Caballeronia sp. LZ035]